MNIYRDLNIRYFSIALQLFYLFQIEENSSSIRFSNYFKTEEAEILAVTSVEQLLRQIVYFPYVRSLCRAYICTTCGNLTFIKISFY